MMCWGWSVIGSPLVVTLRWLLGSTGFGNMLLDPIVGAHVSGAKRVFLVLAEAVEDREAGYSRGTRRSFAR